MIECVIVCVCARARVCVHEGVGDYVCARQKRREKDRTRDKDIFREGEKDWKCPSEMRKERERNELKRYRREKAAEEW